MKRNKHNNPVIDATVEVAIERTDNTMSLRQEWVSGKTGDGESFSVLQIIGGFALAFEIGKGPTVRYAVDLRPILEAVFEKHEDFKKVKAEGRKA